MKLEMREYDGCFSLDFKAETLEEASLLVRFGINATTKLRRANSWVSSCGVAATVVIGKRKEAVSTIPKPK